MTKDQSSAPEGRGETKDPREGNPSGGSPTFPDPSGARPTGNATGFNGTYTETEHHTQHEYDAEHQHGGTSPETSDEEEQED
jgi:hypothetical protein